MSARLPLLVVVACLCAIAAALLTPPTAYSERSITLLFSLFAAAYVLVGAVVSARRPDNPVGWLMLAIGGTMTAPIILGTYAGYALLVDQSLPFGLAAAWTTTWLYLPALCGIVLLVLIFPLGRLSGRFRVWTALAAATGGVVVTVSVALTPGPMDGFGDVANPLGVSTYSAQIDWVSTTSGAIVVGTFLAALTSIFVRLRQARGDERQQLKWFAYATLMMLLAQLPNLLPLGLDDSLLGLLGVVAALTAVPAGVAIAVLRHRLYDIDVVIKRTLVYGSLTLLLLATYLSLVLGFRLLLDPLTSQSDLSVAASTLAVAALFRPARSRIQLVVDRRFFRSRYDAARTVASFAGRLRQEVDIDSMSTDLRGVVRETVQPAHVSLWLREGHPHGTPT